MLKKKLLRNFFNIAEVYWTVQFISRLTITWDTMLYKQKLSTLNEKKVFICVYI